MKTSRKLVAALLICILPIISCDSQKGHIPANGYVAFSLRAAQQLFKSKPGSLDSNAYTLGGITRLVGMLIDRENSDIILIGKKIAGLPKARFDDFVVALRSRFLYDDLPLVSIDPTPNTSKTGMQEVRFGGHIERTLFGKDFIDCDILLKRYSLELEQQIQPVVSYRKLLVDNEISQLKAQEISPLSVYWVNPDSIISYFGKVKETSKSFQSRFWFNYLDPYKVRILDDVFCLMSLDICVQNEVAIEDENSIKVINEAAGSGPDLQFSKLFTNNYYKLSDTYLPLKRMKLLFDMTALAEGLKNTSNLPDINYLIHDYIVSEVETPKQVSLIKQCGVINRSDGKSSLIQVSGGIETSVELEWLNGGDIRYLKKFVLESRPNKNSLCWKIPVDAWEMPNNNGITSKVSKKSGSKGGCSVNVNTVVINNSGKVALNGTNSFEGFTGVGHFAAPLKTNGVQMRMVIDSISFHWADSLKQIGDMIRN